MIKELYNFHDPLNVAYDLLTKDGNKVEVKFSTVLRKCNSVINSENVIKEIIASKLENRILTFENAKKLILIAIYSKLNQVNLMFYIMDVSLMIR